MTGVKLELAVLATALLAVVAFVTWAFATGVIADDRPACSGSGSELAGTCRGSNPGHLYG